MASKGGGWLIDASVAYCVSVLPYLANYVSIALVGTSIVPLATGLANSLRKDFVVAVECI